MSRLGHKSMQKQLGPLFTVRTENSANERYIAKIGFCIKLAQPL